MINFGKIIKILSMTIMEVFHCAYVSTGLRLATEYSFKSILTENIFKTFFILVTNSVIAVPDPVTQLRHEVDLALEEGYPATRYS